MSMSVYSCSKSTCLELFSSTHGRGLEIHKLKVCLQFLKIQTHQVCDIVGPLHKQTA